jgi:hypothetical protein
MALETTHVVLKLPYSLFKDFPSGTPQELAIIEHDKLKIPVKHMQGFFNNTLDEISKHIMNKLKDDKVKNITNVILVGGFSVANIVRERLKSLFPENTNFHCPENAEIATLLGAVIYGQNKIHRANFLKPEKHKPCIIPPTIHSRRSRYSYGIDSHVRFDPEKHPTDKKFKDGKDAFCKDVFWVFLRAGSVLKSTKKGKMSTFTVDKDSKTLDVVIYRTENPNPRFVDEPGCHELGSLVVDMSEGVGIRDREIKIGLQYNDTELSVYAINNRDSIIKTTFDSLDTV